MYLLYLNGTNEGPFEGSFVLLLSIAIAIQSFMESLGKHFQKPLLPSRCTSWNTIHYNGPGNRMHVGFGLLAEQGAKSMHEKFTSLLSQNRHA